jgi:hypothetical protein
MNFSDGQNVIPGYMLVSAADILRPGSRNARWGRGRVGFFYTRYPCEDGRRFHRFPAGEGHEKHIVDPNILRGLFGPDLEKVLPEITFDQAVYARDENGFPVEIGRKQAIERWKTRELANPTNLFGRYGTINAPGGPVEALMLWGLPANGGWDMVNAVVDELDVGEHARIVHGTQELGPVWKFKEAFARTKNIPRPQPEE